MKIPLDIPWRPSQESGATISQQSKAFNRVGLHAQTEKKAQQILVLDGARAIACLVVLAYHMSLLARDYGILPPLQSTDVFTATLAYCGAFFAQFGESGVILFFVLSGFLLFLPYAKALLFESPWPSPRRYYMRRVFRIVPGYYATLFLLIGFFHPEFFNGSHWGDLWAFMTFTMSLDLSSQVNIPFWTLAVEFQFYLLLPVLAWLFGRIVTRGTPGRRMYKLGICLLLMAVWGILTRYWGLYMANSQTDFLPLHAISVALKPYIYGDTGKYLEVFAIGMFIAMVYVYMQNTSATEYWVVKLRQSNLLILVAGLALLVLLPLQHATSLDYGRASLTLNFVDPQITLLVFDWMQWQVIGYSIGYGLCLWALLSGSARLRRPFESAVLRWFGSISFSLYMWHLPLMFLFVYIVGQNVHHQGWDPIVQYGLFWCWTLVVIIPVAAAFYRWVEKPGVSLGERLVAATQTWDKGLPTATLEIPQVAYVVETRDQVRTSTARQPQFKGQLLVRDIQNSAPMPRLVR